MHNNLKRSMISMIFKNELNILDNALRDCSNNELSKEILIEKLKELTQNYKKLLAESQKICKITDVQAKELKKVETEIKILLDNSNQGFLTINSDLLIGKIYNKKCYSIFEKNIANKNITDILWKDSNHKENFINIVHQIFLCKNNLQRENLIKNLPNVAKINNKILDISYKFIDHEENFTESDVIMVILTDITEKMNTMEKISYLSYHDSLTGLYNRSYLTDIILPSLNNKENYPIGMIFADMNGLKFVNDVFGHNKGDEFIVIVSNILKQACSDNDIIVRIGGDEFLIILKNTDIMRCKNIYNKIKSLCSETKWNPIYPSLALGIAMQKTSNFDFEKLFSESERNMYRNKIIESNSFKKAILNTIEKQIFTKCNETPDHIERITNLMYKMIQTYNIEEQIFNINKIDLLVKLHDIGKIAVPNEILCKKLSLTNEEWEIIKSHSEIGYRIAHSLNEDEIAIVILHMHERWDGKGYPYGLEKDEIPLLSRIFSIVETFDVMTSERPFKPAVSKEEAIEEIIRNSGTQFDPELVEVFLSIHNKCNV